MSNKEIVERRKNERFRVKNGAFVALRPHYTKLGQISDIGMDGLSFHYMDREERPNESSDILDIVVTKGDFYENPAEYPAIHGGDECGAGVRGMQSSSFSQKPRLSRRGHLLFF